MVRNSVGRKLAAAAIFTVALSGCKNGISVWNPFAKSDKAALHQDSDGGQWQNEDIQPRESGLTKSFKKLGETVSKPFKKNSETEVATRQDDALTPASKNGPLEPGLHVSLAAMEAKAGHVEAAAEQYRKALEVDPKHLDALMGLARLYDREEDHAQAVEYYRRAVKAHPDNAKPLNDLGICYLRNGMLEESISTLQRAVSAQPESALYRNNLAAVLVEAGRTSEALRTLKPAFGEAGAHYNVAVVLQRCGRNAEALEHVEMAAELDPKLAQAQHMLVALRKETPAETTASNSPRGLRSPTMHQPAPAARATEETDAVTLNTVPAAQSRPVYREPETVQADTVPNGVVSNNTVPLDAPITTPYVPQSDIAPTAKPISRSTVIERPEPRPALKPTTRMPPMNPHQPPQVQIPAKPAEVAVPAGRATEAPTDELIGPKLMQKRPATGDRYEVAGPAKPYPAPAQTALPQSPLARQSPPKPASVAAAPAVGRLPPAGAVMPPLPEQVSTLPQETVPETGSPAPQARTAAGGARYPASRY